jgi:hypothetical protein
MAQSAARNVDVAFSPRIKEKTLSDDLNASKGITNHNPIATRSFVGILV